MARSEQPRPPVEHYSRGHQDPLRPAGRREPSVRATRAPCASRHLRVPDVSAYMCVPAGCPPEQVSTPGRRASRPSRFAVGCAEPCPRAARLSFDLVCQPHGGRTSGPRQTRTPAMPATRPVSLTGTVTEDARFRPLPGGGGVAYITLATTLHVSPAPGAPARGAGASRWPPRRRRAGRAAARALERARTARRCRPRRRRG